MPYDLSRSDIRPPSPWCGAVTTSAAINTSVFVLTTRFLDAQAGALFNLFALAWFTPLALSALWFRKRPAIHKGLMLFANIELMGASITHLLGHTGVLSTAAFIAPSVYYSWQPSQETGSSIGGFIH